MGKPVLVIWGLALWAMLALGGCADLILQDPETIVARVGDDRATLPGADSSDLFLDYALLADQTYADSLYDKRHPKPFDVGPNTYCAGRTGPDDGCVDRLGLTPYAQARLRRWRLIYAENDVSAFQCPPERFGCTAPLPGLGVQIWMRRGRSGGVCPEAVVAFRGTDGGSADDWLSNLRWVLRLLPLYDQYGQVSDYTPGFIEYLRAERCFSPGRTRVVAVGHSLGGGLAQNAGYRDGRIDLVMAFDPSFVTGASDLPRAVREASQRGLEIDQVYESGEIQAYPRWLLRQVSPHPTCDPVLRTVRLHTVTGNAIARHNLSSMTTALLAWSKRNQDAGRPGDRPLPRPDPASCPLKAER